MTNVSKNRGASMPPAAPQTSASTLPKKPSSQPSSPKAAATERPNRTPPETPGSTRRQDSSADDPAPRIAAPAMPRATAVVPTSPVNADPVEFPRRNQLVHRAGQATRRA